MSDIQKENSPTTEKTGINIIDKPISRRDFLKGAVKLALACTIINQIPVASATISSNIQEENNKFFKGMGLYPINNTIIKNISVKNNNQLGVFNNYIRFQIECVPPSEKSSKQLIKIQNINFENVNQKKDKDGNILKLNAHMHVSFTLLEKCNYKDIKSSNVTIQNIDLDTPFIYTVDLNKLVSEIKIMVSDNLNVLVLPYHFYDNDLFVGYYNYKQAKRQYDLQSTYSPNTMRYEYLTLPSFYVLEQEPKIQENNSNNGKLITTKKKYNLHLTIKGKSNKNLNYTIDGLDLHWNFLSFGRRSLISNKRYLALKVHAHIDPLKIPESEKLFFGKFLSEHGIAIAIGTNTNSKFMPLADENETNFKNRYQYIDPHKPPSTRSSYHETYPPLEIDTNTGNSVVKYKIKTRASDSKGNMHDYSFRDIDGMYTTKTTDSKVKDIYIRIDYLGGDYKLNVKFKKGTPEIGIANEDNSHIYASLYREITIETHSKIE